MKIHFLVSALIIVGCTFTHTESERAFIPNDTIKTGSGLQYYYVKMGTGRQIENGSKVTVYNKLYLNQVDTVFWSTDNLEDSVFSYIHGSIKLIEGAMELYPLLREGDHVVAIMPDSIGYGKEGRDNLPGGSTLLFDPIIIKKVTEPKIPISDTLITVIKDGSVDEMMTVYHSIANSDLGNNYHLEPELLIGLFQSMSNDKKYNAIELAAAAFEAMATRVDDIDLFRNYRVSAIAQQGDTARAIVELGKIIAQDPTEDQWKTMLERMHMPDTSARAQN